MNAERYVVLGTAQVRSPWFREVARWANSAMLPVEFVKTMSIEEARVRLRSGRGFSALLIDDSLAGLDRDLVQMARDAGCAVIVIESGRAARQWGELGVAAVLPAGFSRSDLHQILSQVATPVPLGQATDLAPPGVGEASGYRGALVAVTGAGGVGRSTVAMAVAQGLAADPRYLDNVCLADLALTAELAMLHGTQDVVPGVVELAEAHRSGTPSIDAVRALTWRVNERGYHLLLGLRQHRDWTAVRPRAFSAGLDGLRRSFRGVVADVDADLEGERASGSLDVEERNTMARTTSAAAGLIIVVGQPGMKGMHGLLRTVRDLLAYGIEGSRLLPLVNRSPRGGRARAALTATFGELLGPRADHGVSSPVFLPERRYLDDLLRDGARLPDGWVNPLATTVGRLLDTHDHGARIPLEVPEMVPVRPGSLGSWTPDEPEDTEPDQ